MSYMDQIKYKIGLLWKPRINFVIKTEFNTKELMKKLCQ